MRLLRRMVCFFDMLFQVIGRASWAAGLGPVTCNSQLLTEKQRLYCCLLFFFNFFQYVKELSGPGHDIMCLL